MVSMCANPECGADFLYMYEGQIFLIQQLDKTIRPFWLCNRCAAEMEVVCGPLGTAKVVPKSSSRSRKQPGSEALTQGPRERVS